MGFPRRSMIVANSRATRTPDRDVSASEPLSAIGPRSAELFAIGSRTLACGERQAFARAVVDHGQRAEPPPIRQLIRHKIQGPLLIWGHWHQHRRPRAVAIVARTNGATLAAPFPATPAPDMQYRRENSPPDCFLILLNPRDTAGTGACDGPRDFPAAAKHAGDDSRSATACGPSPSYLRAGLRHRPAQSDSVPLVGELIPRINS